MELVKNMLIKWLDDKAEVIRIERILWIEPGRTSMYTFDIEDPSALPVWRTYAEIVEALNEAQAMVIQRQNRYLLQPEEQFTEKQRQRRDQNWALIAPIVNAGEAAFIPHQRNQLIEGVVKQTGRSKRLIYDYLRRYWQAGQIKNGLMPRFEQRGLKADQEIKPEAAKRGRPRDHGRHPGVNINAVTKKLLEKGYKRFYVNDPGKSLTEAYELTLMTFFCLEETVDVDGVAQPTMPAKEKLPTLEQFKYHCHYPRNRIEVLNSREGESRTSANYGPKLGSASLMAFGSGSWYLLDSTPADCLLVSSLNRNHILGKPTVYFAKDLFSMLITGFEASLEEASWLAEVLAIQNALTDKVAFCQKYGLTISPADWPCHYAPEFLLHDRGEGESYHASNLVNSIGIQVSNTPPFRPDLKGPVELDFHLANHYAIHKLPGGGPPPQKRGEKDHRGLPCLTPYEFRRAIISYILFYNKSHILEDYPFDEFMIADEVKPIPLDLWNWGIANRSGHLRVVDPDVAYQNLLPRAQATLTRQGLEFKALRYFSQYAAEQQWYLKAGKQTGQKRKKVTVAYDPRTTNSIFLCLQGQALEQCPLLERDQGYANREWIEVDAQKAFEAGQRVELENNRFQAMVELNARLDHISSAAQQAAEAARKEAGQPKRIKAKDMREHKRRERDLERQQATQAEGEKMAAELVELAVSRSVEPEAEKRRHLYIPQTDYSDLIHELFEAEADHD